MSDVLAFAKPGSLLLTGLTNAQVIKTAAAEILLLSSWLEENNLHPKLLAWQKNFKFPSYLRNIFYLKQPVFYIIKV